MNKNNIFTRAKKKKAFQKLENNQFDEARLLFEKITRTDPRDAESWTALSTIYDIQKNHKKSIYYAKKALDITKKSHDAWFNLANAQREIGELNAALNSYEKVLLLQPQHVGALCNAAGLYLKKNLFQKSEIYFKRASKLAPNIGMIFYNLGKAYASQGKYDDALSSYQHALRINPDNIDCLNNLGRLSLLLGDFENGWQYYKHRLSQRQKGAIPPPSSLPDDLKGKRIYITYDQGLGDEIFFLRFLPILKQRGAWIAYYPGEKIRSIINRVSDIDYVCPDEIIPDNIDFKFSIGDLPLLVNINKLDKICQPLPLLPIKESMNKIQDMLKKAGPPPYIGITWRSGTKDTLLLYKEIPLEQFIEPLKKIEGTIVILQRLPEEGEIDNISSMLGRQVCDCSELNDQLEDMLALLSILDDYIGVSNTNTHLRAGVEQPCRVLVPFPPEWRWMTSGNSSPWFPYFRVYRQDADRDWGQSLQQLKDDIT